MPPTPEDEFTNESFAPPPPPRSGLRHPLEWTTEKAHFLIENPFYFRWDNFGSAFRRFSAKISRSFPKLSVNATRIHS